MINKKCVKYIFIQILIQVNFKTSFLFSMLVATTVHVFKPHALQKTELIADFFATQIIGGAKELVVLL